ncbi:hypothetical protein SDC9_145619 [bioreactor metagenome]|uniref:Uncharacterized protein n=1 Tax=bioreactor metagenome TaxID=1076179 RepID=A0A645ECE1_9ZZZZ
MVFEANIFRSNEGVDHVGRQLVVTGVHTVFFAERPGAHYFAVFGEDFGGKLVIRVFQFFNRGHVTYPSVCNGGKQHNGCH